MGGVMTDEQLAEIERRAEEAQAATGWETVDYAAYAAKAPTDTLALIAEVRRLRSEREWQPIETAPRDGSEIVLWGPCRPIGSSCKYAADANVGWWNSDHWSTRVGGETCDATHWLPLPTIATARQP